MTGPVVVLGTRGGETEEGPAPPDRGAFIPMEPAYLGQVVPVAKSTRPCAGYGPR